MSNANLGSFPTWIDDGLDACVKWLRAPLQPVVDCIAPWQKDVAANARSSTHSRARETTASAWTGCRLQLAANDGQLSTPVAMRAATVGQSAMALGASPQRLPPKCPVPPRLRLSGKLCDVCAELDRLCSAHAHTQDQRAA